MKIGKVSYVSQSSTPEESPAPANLSLAFISRCWISLRAQRQENDNH